MVKLQTYFHLKTTMVSHHNLHSNKWLNYKRKYFDANAIRPTDLHSNKWLNYKLFYNEVL